MHIVPGGVHAGQRDGVRAVRGGGPGVHGVQHDGLLVHSVQCDGVLPGVVYVVPRVQHGHGQLRDVHQRDGMHGVCGWLHAADTVHVHGVRGGVSKLCGVLGDEPGVHGVCGGVHAQWDGVRGVSQHVHGVQQRDGVHGVHGRDHAAGQHVVRRAAVRRWQLLRVQQHGRVRGVPARLLRGVAGGVPAVHGWLCCVHQCDRVCDVLGQRRVLPAASVNAMQHVLVSNQQL